MKKELSSFTDRQLAERWQRDSVAQREARHELENRGYTLQFKTPNNRTHQSSQKLGPHAFSTDYRFRKATTIEEILP